MMLYLSPFVVDKDASVVVDKCWRVAWLAEAYVNKFLPTLIIMCCPLAQPALAQNVCDVGAGQNC
jgi:hypothetical protein